MTLLNIQVFFSVTLCHLEDHTASIFRVKWSKQEPHMKKVCVI